MQSVPNILNKLAESLGTEVKNNKLEIPQGFGTGYCAGYVFNDHIRMLVSDYELHDDLDIINPDIDAAKNVLFFKFKNIFPEQKEKHISNIPSVLIGTSRVNTEEVIAIHTNTDTINIEADASYLNGLFNQSDKSPVLQGLLLNTQPLLFEQVIYPSLHKIVNDILTEPVDKNFQLFFLRVKAEELICRLLMELDKRDEKHLFALNNRDIQTIYMVRDQMLKCPEMPPVINELAVYAGMSPTKLKRLFKQIFGNSIFNYYQQFRMQKAALLLKEGKLSVSEVGYKMGFVNLSHFSRVFEQHIGIKPKRYSLM